MSSFLMFGKYSPEALKKISGKRTDKAVSLINSYGGEVISMYAMLGEYDLLLIVNFPSMEQAMKTSIALNKMTAISFTTSPAISVENFDKLSSDI
ncbi:MAG: GYD domain-containing protein [bacterium]|nr:GYD domain-containing protein [bacterium]